MYLFIYSGMKDKKWRNLEIANLPLISLLH